MVSCLLALAVCGGFSSVSDTSGHLGEVNPPIYFGYSGNVNGGVRTETAPNPSNPLEGYTIKWEDKGESKNGSLVVKGEASKTQVKISIKGTVSITNDGSSYNQSERQSHQLEISFAMPEAVEWADIEFKATGSASARSLSEDGASSSAGIGTWSFPFDTDQKASSETHGSESSSDSDQKQIDLRWKYRMLFPLGRYSHRDKPPYISKSQPHLFRDPQGRQAKRGFTVALSPFLLASAAGKGSKAFADLDLTIVIDVTPSNYTPQKSQDFAFDLTKATTKDSKSVSVTFDASGADEGKEVEFSVYRSASSSKTLTSGPPIGTQRVRIRPGSNQKLEILKGTRIPFDKERPYIVVTTTVGKEQDTAYFRKWKLGVVVHGYTLPQIIEGGKYYEQSKKACEDLKTYKSYDEAIAFEWQKESRDEDPAMLDRTADRLAGEVTLKAASLISNHVDDVVDIHWIGHSRGTLVICSAMSKINSNQDLKTFFGTGEHYLTLVDIHPAHPNSNTLRSRVDNPIGRTFDGYAKDFGEKVRDDDPTIERFDGLRSITIYYQKSDVSELTDPDETIINLWGLGGDDSSRVNNKSGLAIDWKKLTGSVGHSTIWNWVLLNVK